MSLAVAIQMDPIEAIDIQGDSSFVLALEAQRRGHALFHYLPKALSLKDGRVYARMQPLEVRREAGNHFTLGAPQLVDLATADVVLIRQDRKRCVAGTGGSFGVDFGGRRIIKKKNNE